MLRDPRSAIRTSHGRHSFASIGNKMPSMKTIVASTLWLAASLHAFGTAPLEVTGVVYSETVDVAAPGPARSRSRVEVLLREGGIDAAAFLSLAAGAYLAEVSSSVSGDSGQVLIEVYVLP